MPLYSTYEYLQYHNEAFFDIQGSEYFSSDKAWFLESKNFYQKTWLMVLKPQQIDVCP